jgi:cytochrome c-type biogenesis protein
VLPLIPGYLSFITGLTLEELQSKEDKIETIKKTSLNSLFFILGFSVVFMLLGASATFFGKLLISKIHIFNKIAGIIIFVFGFHLIGIYRIPWLDYEKRFHARKKGLGLFESFLIGLAFAFGWSPCIGPILAGILLLASNQQTVTQGMGLLLAYSLGLGIPFMITGIGFNLFLEFFSKIKKHFRTIETISGIFLMVIGVLIFFNAMGYISSFLIRLFPGLLKG